jgi:hypothetical protein
MVESLPILAPERDGRRQGSLDPRPEVPATLTGRCNTRFRIFGQEKEVAFPAAQHLADADPAGGRKRAGAWPVQMCENGSTVARAAGQHSSRPLGRIARSSQEKVWAFGNAQETATALQ